MSPPRVCPACGDHLEACSLKGRSLERCAGCDGLWLGRQTVLDLRRTGAVDEPWLAEPSSPRPPTGAARLCPSCHKELESYRYRGGAVTVDRCRSCDHFFLDPGELRQILEEWERGFELSDRGRAALASAHAERLVKLDGSKGLVYLGSVLEGAVLILSVVDPGWGLDSLKGLFVGAGLLLIIAGLLWQQKRRAIETEKQYHKAKIEELVGEPRPRRSPEERPRRCPWCRAPLPEGATYCEACESDVL